MIPFLFSKTFNIMSEKQTINELNMGILLSRWIRFVSVLIVALLVITKSLY